VADAARSRGGRDQRPRPQLSAAPAIDGIVQFVVGTGGRRRYDVDESDRRLAKEEDSRFGALRLRLTGNVATYAFVATGGQTLDSGAISCDRGS
jgi:hypothetical protein